MTFEKVTPLQIKALKNILGLGAILVDLNKVDFTRGRVETAPNCFKMWTTERKRISISTVMHGEGSPAMIASQTKELADDWPEIPAFPDFNPYLTPCINPFCDKGEGRMPALVDVSQKKSGACCKMCMNYEYTHPDCISRAKANNWPKATHPWGSKIAKAHREWRKQ